MELHEWYEKGLTPEQYIEQMSKHKESFLHVLKTFHLSGDEAALVNKLREAKWRVVVITEDWCGDAMLNVPILFALAKAADMDVRLLLRDENLELMDQYLTNGTSRAIPIFIFINEEGEEQAVWGPRAPAVQEMVTNYRSSLPPRDHHDFEEKSREMVTRLTEAYRTDETLWQEVYRSLKTTIAERLY
ncbi:thioredoxin family protein [Domibacillus epiphyticus]|uniref:Thioredoxin family protein n=1 Tax=Domibacillus epiphyticus TaxID=1714355 RepID=A0A1V2AAL0_9BACI|nr:thioredoxin family protein [Domibacillus epiphyticus]OMP68028.1 thioredoxin family protein [Domibacillus epiphyticus]